MAERDERIDRLLLSQEIADFLYREAELLDERRYREWLDLPAATSSGLASVRIARSILRYTRRPI